MVVHALAGLLCFIYKTTDYIRNNEQNIAVRFVKNRGGKSLVMWVRDGRLGASGDPGCPDLHRAWSQRGGAGSPRAARALAAREGRLKSQGRARPAVRRARVIGEFFRKGLTRINFREQPVYIS